MFIFFNIYYMKYLKKYENQNHLFIDDEYVKECFLNLIEGPQFRQIQMWKHNTMMELSFNLPKPKVKNYANSWFEDINTFISHGEEVHKLYLDIEESVNKLKIEYPDYKVEYKLYTQGFDPNVFTVRIEKLWT